MKHTSDFLVLGSGIAGLTYALKVAQHGKVVIITKENPEESNTKYAQGGIAAVWNEGDNFEKHITDTLECGGGLCNEKVVEIVVKESTERINELIEWGTKFDKNEEGEYDLAKEGGHSEHRVLHHKDITGWEIERTLLKKVHQHKNITVLDHHFALEVITQHHLGVEVTRKTTDIECFGAYVMNNKTGSIDTYLAKTTLMATGGAGHVYLSTTNPLVATGDGIAMAYRAKITVKDMEFVQFHPTSLYNPGENPSFLVSEAVRGFGARLVNRKGEYFMKKYDSREDLAPRDIVARSIDKEMKIHGDDFVYLDCTHLDMDKFKEHFPNIYNKCVSIGIHPEKNFIPVVPAQHYTCGGVEVDENGLSSAKNLYAIGECSCTGLHGANRLASNSLLEAVVFAHRAAMHSAEAAKNTSYKMEIPEWNDEGTEAAEEMVLITQSLKEVKMMMSTYLGIVRSNIRMKRALDRLEIIYQETEALYKKTTASRELCELRNVINVAYLIIKWASMRKESVGLHFSLDYTAEAIKK